MGSQVVISLDRLVIISGSLMLVGLESTDSLKRESGLLTISLI